MKALFKQGERVIAARSLYGSPYHTGVRVGAGDLGDVLLVVRGRVYVDWGHGIRSWHHATDLAHSI